MPESTVHAPVRSVSGASVLGPRHARAGRVNEDALGWSPFDRSLEPLRTVAAVSDGHGSPMCSRSERGAAIAVQAGLTAGQTLLRGAGGTGSADPRELIALASHLWRDAVDRDLAAHPLSPEQVELVEQAGPHTDLRLAYGCTLLLCAVTGTSVLLAQIGDGGIATLTDDGRGWFPLGPNPEHGRGASDSLCLPGAEDRARTATLDAGLPHLLMLMTDGCTNAYPSTEDLLMIGADTVRLEAETGLRRANLTLESWLATTADATEDDATLVSVWM
ncbi:protein phosphatase 2C domain-containing protein [Spongisporangium articulatum]|uniref:Protein phosphatase 2C domain-containing protein n=1 Tax=Spongisporangium articulatum TaxID=3362603 RepID=A0ABW8AI53_9ACTN